MTRKSAFAPVVAAHTRVLVLGSLPGEVSLAAQRYYAHPANQFWRLIGGVIERDLVPLDYETRLAALLEAGVGLWDSVATARRAGSLDTAIREVEAAPLADLAATLAGLRAVGFNGGTSWRIGRRQLAARHDLALVQLPSSSPAYCRVTPAEKQASWDFLRKYLR
ncbi:DNA-deoxyinosine glycosylase [Novosphingobium sp. KCTC 2891]|uniref:DNA-deoxyinosine glycosylase n=1 Tax=Novosphingobium sp. KCTC 2891 TaxID=2989730 RepID=UPI00222334E1|nr:DNA-deoxyinosine glycosylase [Novosphingobium sp. KCTC 2891]MCW1381558.1 DNA-deoxyinosine glycosylase [Novosphingobium sp. KCTC 2891]